MSVERPANRHFRGPAVQREVVGGAPRRQAFVLAWRTGHRYVNIVKNVEREDNLSVSLEFIVILSLSLSLSLLCSVYT